MHPTKQAFSLKRRHGRRSATAAGLARFLVPVDFSVESDCALRYARTFARRFGSTITLLHVVEPLTCAADYGYGPVTMRYPNPHLVKRAEARLCALARGRARSAARCETMVRTGVAEAQILKAARDLKADLIVMGPHENRNPARADVSSTAERVVRSAACPVLVVRKKDNLPSMA